MAGLFFAFNTASAQLRKIPAEVTESLKSKYPSASAVEWKDKITVFQADFQMNGEKYEARFNSDGQWQETEKNVDQDKLPPAVKEGFNKSKYTDWEMKEVSYIEKKDGGEQYRILVKKSDIEKKYLYFDKTGKLVKDVITL